jgi:hypothetical protein
MRSRVQTPVERFPVRQQAQLQGAIARQPVAPLAKQFAGRTARHQRHLQSPRHFGDVVGVNAAGGLRVETGQQTVQAAGAPHLPRRQPLAQGLVALRSLKQPVHERQPPPRRNLPNRAPRHPRVFAGREKLVGIGHVDQVMGHAPPLRQGQLRRADIEMPEHLQRIAVDDLAGERLGQYQRQFTLPRSGRTGHCNQPALPRIVCIRWSRLVQVALTRTPGAGHCPQRPVIQ